MKQLIILFVSLAVALPSSAATDRLFPFPIEGHGLWRIRDGFAPAGENGFISAKGHRFVDEKGNVRRFLGVNLYGPAQMPTKADAERTAKQLAFWGFNAVRVMPQYTWQKREDGDFSKGPDPELLDRFDYFFAKLKERGLYATMNLHSARTACYRFKDFKQTMKENKGLDNFDPTFIEHQKEWDRFVFEHVNPYTGLAYKDDPAVLSWEINNECSLGVTWFQWDLWKNLTPPFKAELSRQFSGWLREKYGSTEGLRTVWRTSSPLKPDVIPSVTWRDAAAFDRVNWYTEGWSRGGPGPRDFRFDPATGAVAVDARKVRKFALVGAPLDEGELFTVRFRVRSPKQGVINFKVGQHGRPYANQGINRTFTTGPDWQEVRLMSSAVVAEKANRVQIEFKKMGDYEIAGLSFVCGGEAGLAAGESLEAANVQPVGLGSPVRAKDVSDFILDVEDRYWKEMVRYLKEDLKAKQLVNGGTINYGAGYPQAYADFIDQHYYYGGLATFPGAKWSKTNWKASNRLMVLNLDDSQAERGFNLRVFGKPYTISEASQMHQAATASDFFPILLSLSAFQDHAAVYAYTWTHVQDHAYSGNQWLDMHGNAKYLAHLPAACNMFVRGDVKDGFGEPAKIVYELGRAEEREQIRKTGYALKSHSMPTDPLAMVKAVTGLRYTDLASDPATADAPATPYGKPEGRVRRAVSSTGEIVWDASDEARAFYAVDTPRTKFLSQFGPAGTEHRFADGTVFTLGDTLMGWAALSLTETATNQFLLAATGWQQPTGAVLTVYGQQQPITPEKAVKLNGAGITSQTAMGDVPFVCEGVRARVRLPVPPNRLVRVTPLNGNALPAAEPVDCAAKDGFVSLDIGEKYKTVWYRIEFREYDLPAFGEKVSACGYDSTKPDCGLTAAKVFDGQIAGLTKIGTLRIPTSKEMPEDSTASIGFEGLDRKLFEPVPEVYERLGAMGVKWARVQTMWSRCEPQKGVYDFSELDEIVDRLVAQGIRPWFCVSFGNANYMPHCYTKAAVGCMPLYYGEECRAAWSAYVRELAKRYRSKVTHWEIWNEPNLPQFWQPRAPNAADYLELVKLTGGIIREEIADAKIGGTTASSGLDAWERNFFKLGGAKAIDFWCCHAYGRVPEAFRKSQLSVKLDPKRTFVGAQRDVRREIDEAGGKHVEIWQGEAGYPSWLHKDHWLFPKGVCQHGWQSQANQAKWLLRRFLTDRRAGFARSSFYQTADISRLYSMATITRPHAAEHGVLNGWTYEPKMSYYAFGHYNALFATARADETVEVAVTPVADADRRVETAAFRTADGALRVVWYVPTDYGDTYVGKGYAPRTDATLTIPATVAPKEPVLIDPLRGGVYAICTDPQPTRGRVGNVCGAPRAAEGVTYAGLPLVDYPLVLAERATVPCKDL